jgi:plastocyanin
MRCTRVVLAAILAALALPGAAVAATFKVSAGAPPTAPAPGSFLAGLYDADAFYPGSHATLKIHKGDRVTFSGGFHTATILGSAPRGPLEFIQPGPAGSTYAAVNDEATIPAPFYWGGLAKFVYNGGTLAPIGGTTVNSKTATYSSGGLFASPAGYTLKFSKTGTFTIVCLLHPGMKGKIQVLSRNRHITSVSRVARRARAEVQTDIGRAVDIDSNLPRSVQDPTSAIVTVGAGSTRTSLFSFYPSALSVKVGTTVTFRSGSVNEPHNIGIGDINYQIPHLALIDLFPNGPTDPNQVNPNLFYGSDPPVAGVRTFTGAASHGNGYMATNVVWKSSPIPGIASETKVMFTTPGTYTYMCQIHFNMIGTINVHPVAP